MEYPGHFFSHSPEDHYTCMYRPLNYMLSEYIKRTNEMGSMGHFVSKCTNWPGLKFPLHLLNASKRYWFIELENTGKIVYLLADEPHYIAFLLLM